MMTGEDTKGSVSDSRAETLMAFLAALDRCKLIDALREADCGFQVNFSDDFLAEVSMDRLRHIVLAAMLQDRSHIAPRQH